MEKRPTSVFIDKEAVKYNYLRLKKQLAGDVKILAVVKADAYGHGAVEVSRTLEDAGCKHFGVALCEEAIELRGAGIKSDILILGGIYDNQIQEIIKYNLTPVVFDIKTLAALNSTANKKIKIHIKIDTGMGRLGILPEEVVPFFKKLKNLKHIEPEGIMTHLAEMDEDDKGFTGRQMDLFLRIINTIKGMGFEIMFKHIANSAAVVNVPGTHFNLVRPGIMLYGSYPAERLKKRIRLKPVMSIKTQIVQLKKLPPGSSVSYGRTFTTKAEGLIAVVPIGYGDGYPRHLSNKGEMLVRGRRAKISGIVCMDLTMLDVTGIKDAQEGDEVTIIGKDGDEEITVEELAEKAGTIPYEIMCGINKRVPRVYR